MRWTLDFIWGRSRTSIALKLQRSLVAIITCLKAYVVCSGLQLMKVQYTFHATWSSTLIETPLHLIWYDAFLSWRNRQDGLSSYAPQGTIDLDRISLALTLLIDGACVYSKYWLLYSRKKKTKNWWFVEFYFLFAVVLNREASLYGHCIWSITN